MFPLICTRINGWVNNGEAGELRRYRVHYDVIVMGLYVEKILLPKTAEAQKPPLSPLVVGMNFKLLFLSDTLIYSWK